MPLVTNLAEIILKVLSLEYRSQELQKHQSKSSWLTGTQPTVILNYKTVLALSCTVSKKQEILSGLSQGFVHLLLTLLLILYPQQALDAPDPALEILQSPGSSKQIQVCPADSSS